MDGRCGNLGKMLDGPGFFEGFVGLLEETYLHILFWVMICEKASPRKSQETNLAPFVLAASRQM